MDLSQISGKYAYLLPQNQAWESERKANREERQEQQAASDNLDARPLQPAEQTCLIDASAALDLADTAAGQIIQLNSYQFENLHQDADYRVFPAQYV